MEAGKEGNHHLLEDMILSNELATERGPLPMVDFRSVRSATGNFSSSNLLGEGGFGPVYKVSSVTPQSMMALMIRMIVEMIMLRMMMIMKIRMQLCGW